MNQKPALSDWLLLILLSLIWGSSYILMKKGLEAFSPAQVACFRILITAIVLLPFVLIRWKEIPRSKLGYILLQALFGNFFPAFLFPAAQQYVDSSVAGILNALSPVFVFIIGIFFFRISYTWMKVVGTAVAFGGTALLMVFQNSHGITTNGTYGLLIVLATFSYGLAANIIKGYLSDVRPITITAAGFAMLMVPTLITLFFTDMHPVLHADSTTFEAFGYIFILAVGGSAIASVIYARLIHNTTALFAASVSYLSPIVALSWGLLAGEHIGMADYAGMVLIFLGVYLVGR